MTTLHIECPRDSGLATWGLIGAMGLSAAALGVWQSVAVPGLSAPTIVTSAQDCAACHAGQTVLASATIGHADVGLDLVLAPGAAAVHSAQDCASCHVAR